MSLVGLLVCDRHFLIEPDEDRLAHWALRSGRLTVHPEVEFTIGQHSVFSQSGILASPFKKTPQPSFDLKISTDPNECHRRDCE